MTREGSAKRSPENPVTEDSARVPRTSSTGPSTAPSPRLGTPRGTGTRTPPLGSVAGKIDANLLLYTIEPLIFDVIAWFRRRHAEAGTLPSDAEVIARVKDKVAVIVADGEQALQEFPASDESDPTTAAGRDATPGKR